MPTYEKAPNAVKQLARDILDKYDRYKPVRDAEVTFDILMAFGDRDDDGNIVGDAIKWHGLPAYGLCRIVNLRDRSKGLADCEIQLDGDHWENIGIERRMALLDHELWHAQVCMAREGGFKRDALGRPKLRMRKHDFEIGVFSIIAETHGEYSEDRLAMRQVMEKGGQYFWPELYAGTGEKILKLQRTA